MDHDFCGLNFPPAPKEAPSLSYQLSRCGAEEKTSDGAENCEQSKINNGVEQFIKLTPD